MQAILRPDNCLRFLKPGRLVALRCLGPGPPWGIGVVVNLSRQATPQANGHADGNGSEQPAPCYVVDTLLECQPGSAAGSHLCLYLVAASVSVWFTMSIVIITLPIESSFGPCMAGSCMACLHMRGHCSDVHSHARMQAHVHADRGHSRAREDVKWLHHPVGPAPVEMTHDSSER